MTGTARLAAGLPSLPGERLFGRDCSQDPRHAARRLGNAVCIVRQLRNSPARPTIKARYDLPITGPHMSRPRMDIALAVLALACVGFDSLANETCPATIQTQQAMTGTYSGWATGVDEVRSSLIGIKVSDGEPKDLAWRVPDRTLAGGTQEWTLGASPRGYWVTCVYDRTRVVLNRKLPAGTKRCRVFYDSTYAQPLATKYACE